MNETLTILDKVNSFYSASFNSLLTITAILLAFVGVLVPFLITFYQNKKQQLEREELNNLINEKSDALKKEIMDYALDILYEEKKKIDNELQKISKQAKGQALHLQGNSNLDKKHYKIALLDYSNAGICYIHANDEMNLQRIMRSIKKCLSNLHKVDLDESKEITDAFNKFIGDFESFNENNRYTDSIDELRAAFNSVESRRHQGN